MTKKALRLLTLFILLTPFASSFLRAATHKDIEYGQAAGVSLRLDAFVPDGPGPHPAVILVHGGGWTGGDKDGGRNQGYMMPLHAPLTAAGFAWFSINYRLAPAHRHPAAVEDVETAIRWVKAHAAEYRVDPRRLALSGESAGGHLVALAAVRADASTRVAAVAPIYGVFDLAAEAQRRQGLIPSFNKLLGRDVLDETMQKLMHDASPIHFVKPGLPPFLLMHGDADQTVAYQQSLDMQARPARCRRALRVDHGQRRPPRHVAVAGPRARLQRPLRGLAARYAARPGHEVVSLTAGARASAPCRRPGPPRIRRRSFSPPPAARPRSD
jgi:acetyl esterase/lipase